MKRCAGFAVVGVLALLVSGCIASGAQSGPHAVIDAAHGELAGLSRPGEPVVVASGLELPWSIAFLPGGDALVSERDSARVLRVSPAGRTTVVGTVPGVRPKGEGGLLGLAVSPEFITDPAVFAYLTTADDNRVVRMDYRPDGTLGDPEVLVDGIPKAPRHNGGRIAFGPDGMLYAGTGDAGRPENAQDPASLAGKILRMTSRGRPADRNPFGNLVFSYGHRNVEGLAWDREDRLFGIEFGEDSADEVNLIQSGANYGWPRVEGTAGAPEYVDPVLTWRPAEATPGGAAIAGGSLWVAATRGERLWRAPLTGRDRHPVGRPESLHEGRYGRIRTVTAVPGGTEIWMSTANRDGKGGAGVADDRILRVPLAG